MKKIIIISLSFIIMSCNENTELSKRATELQKTNDSLMTVLNTLKTKYIFDHVFVRHIPAENKELKIGQKYTGEFFFVAYNDEDKVLFSQEKNPSFYDTLEVKRKTNAAYVYESTVRKDTNNYVFKPIINNKTALEFKNSIYGSGNLIADKRIVK
ncbi:hypothetical protein [Flavobacterium sp. N2270]|uniref:hypothetical protein n=1 Tax=Flavobacterium sp. N2270 TaxID=2986831 RepID=UPI0022240331|nr:hypothetical protein [Flavobacterium sp. N2270]